MKKIYEEKTNLQIAFYLQAVSGIVSHRKEKQDKLYSLTTPTGHCTGQS